jgi:glucose-1-phosphate cytidylyltransferase
VSDIDISKLVAFHNTHGKLATLTAIVPEGRFGKLEIENGVVTDFGEKKDNSDKRVNG